MKGAWRLTKVSFGSQPKRAASARNVPGAAPCSHAGKRSQRGRTPPAAPLDAMSTARPTRWAEMGTGLLRL